MTHRTRHPHTGRRQRDGQGPRPRNPATCSPAFSIAGVMPAASQMTWKTSFPNPDSLVAAPRPAGHGPTFSVAGVVQGTADNGWRTAMPDPTRDTLDANGHVISKVEAAAPGRARRSPGPGTRRRPQPRRLTHPLRSGGDRKRNAPGRPERPRRLRVRPKVGLRRGAPPMATTIPTAVLAPDELAGPRRLLAGRQLPLGGPAASWAWPPIPSGTSPSWSPPARTSRSAASSPPPGMTAFRSGNRDLRPWSLRAGAAMLEVEPEER